MAEKLLVCVAAEQVTAGRWRRGHLEECRVFTNDQSGFAAFEKYISQFSGVPAYLMVDAVEEDYRFETLPHAFGFRPGIQLDKLGQLPDELEAETFAASLERSHDPPRPRRSRKNLRRPQK